MKCLDKLVLHCGQKVPDGTPQMNKCPNNLYIGTKCLVKLILLLCRREVPGDTPLMNKCLNNNT
jgi:hypothetical protein